MDLRNANSRGVAMAVVVKDQELGAALQWCYDAVQIPISHGEFPHQLSVESNKTFKSTIVLMKPSEPLP
jgi:hypothetical protein